MSLRDVIMGCSVDIRRNIAGLPFSTDAQTADGAEGALEELCEEYCLRVAMPSYPDAAVLGESIILGQRGQLSEPAKLRGTDGVTIITGGIDRFVFRVDSRERDISSVYARCAGIERVTGRYCDYAFNENLGYLTACLEDTGTGMHARALLHLPALTELEKIDDTRKQLEKEGFELVKLLDGEENASAFYLMSSKITLGKSCEEVLESVKEEMLAVESAERTVRESLVFDDPDDFADKVLRSLAVLENARLLTYAEFLELYSDVRMGITGTLLNGDVDELDEFAESMSPHGIYVLHGDVNDRDDNLYRASEVRRKLKQAVTRREME